MERSEILAAMGGLKLFGMKAAYDEIVATAVKRQHEPQRIIGDLLTAELSEKQARSMRYQLTIAKLPFAKEIDEFAFADTPVNETLCMISPAVASWHSSAIWSWSAARALAIRTSLSVSPAPASGEPPAVASSMSSTWSTGSTAKPATDTRAASPTVAASSTSCDPR